MKIKSLEITGFGPFKDKQLIDFDSLSQDGIFMLEGPTGAGKSSIIDAIVWALYGTTAHESASGISKSSSARIRSDYANPGDESKVILTFKVQDQTYKITRTPKYSVPKTRGEGTRDEDATASLVEVAAGSEITTGPDAVAAKVQDILGLSREQFSQLVVLPQGDFAKFLHASNDERSSVLQKIFKTQLYEKIENYASEMRKTIEKRIQGIEAEATRHIRNLKQEDDENIHNFAELEEFLLDKNESKDERKDRLNLISNSLMPESNEDQNELSKIQDILDSLRTELTHLESSMEKIDKKEFLQSQYEKLANQSEEFARKESKLKTRELIAPIGAQLDLRDEALAAKKEAEAKIPLDYFEMDSEEVQGRLKELKPKIRTLDNQAARNEAIGIQIEAIEKKITENDTIFKAKKRVKEISSELAKLKKKLKKDQDALEVFEDNLDKKNISEVAKLLKKNQPCPVCGSKEHPIPASRSGDFTDAHYKEINSSINSNSKKISGLESELKAEKKIAGKVSGNNSELRNKLKELRNRKKEANENSSELGKLLSEQSSLSDGLQYFIQYEKAEKDCEKFELKISDVLKKSKCKDEDELRALLALNVEKMREELKSFEAEMSRVKGLLDDESMENLPEKGELDSKIALHKEQIASNDLNFKSISARIAQGEGLQKRVTIATDGIMKALNDIELEIENGKSYVELDKLVNGTNPKSLQLSNYVLQERFALVLEVASHHLLRISKSKYSFVLSTEKVNAKKKYAGLDVKILDYKSGKERPVDTMSGGETFYASLALALGLAEVVRAGQGGVELDTLFIDEGFGSLSGDTLEEVLDVLEELRKSRTIGVISHVESMKSKIPLRIEVRVSDEGPSFVRNSSGGMD
ncbi:MAG: SMC family ATPase [Burkholderiales bacterium]